MRTAGWSLDWAVTRYRHLGPPVVLGVSTQVPTVATLSVNSGSSAGGTNVVLTGINYNSVLAVRFGTAPATSFTVNSPTQITAVSPAGTGGATVNITVTTPAGTSAQNVNNAFTYTSSGTVLPNVPVGVWNGTTGPIFATEWATLGTSFPTTQWCTNDGGIGAAFTSAGGSNTSLDQNLGMGVIPASLPGAGSSSPGLNLAVDSSGNSICIDTYNAGVSPGFSYQPQPIASGQSYCIESSILMPGSGGLYYNWPAFWSVRIPSQGGLGVAEYDVFEAFGVGETHLLYGLNYSAPNFNNPGAGSWAWPGNVYQTYTSIINSDQMSTYYNQTFIHSFTNANVHPPYATPITAGLTQYLLLNNAGKYNNPVNSVNMVVKYTRVWKNF